MADPPVEHAAHAGSGLGKKLGPLPIWGWAVVIIGSYLLFKYLKDRGSAATTVGTDGTVNGSDNANSLVGTEGASVNGAGQIVDTATGDILGSVSGTGGSSGLPDTTTAQGWLAAAQSALQGLGVDNNTSNQALTDYVEGVPLPQAEYNLIEAATKIIGAAPAAIGPPNLIPTPAPTPTPSPAPITQTNAPSGAQAPLASSLFGKVIGNIVSTFASGSGFTYVTDKGYVYNSPGANYYGGTNGGAIGGAAAANIVQAFANPDGGYTLVNNAGQTYVFGPSANASSGQYANVKTAA